MKLIPLQGYSLVHLESGALPLDTFKRANGLDSESKLSHSIFFNRIHQSTWDIECSKPTTVLLFYALFSSFEIYFSLVGNKQ